MELFRPAEGAVLDLPSLAAVAEGPARLLDGWLGVAWPGASSLVLDGLVPQGEPAAVGPPGTVRLPVGSEGVTITPGRAVLSTRDGQRILVQVDEPMFVKWPGSAGPATRGVLVLIAQVAAPEGPVRVARERVQAALRFARPDQAEEPVLLPLAMPTGNGQDWITDLRRTMQPESTPMLTLLKRFERLEQAVWRAEPEGAVWDRQVLGRNWVRYQTTAAAAIAATRMVLVARPSTTLDRVRVLSELHHQLMSSVEPAAAELRQWFGTPESAGPYRGLLGQAVAAP